MFTILGVLSVIGAIVAGVVGIVVLIWAMLLAVGWLFLAVIAAITIIGLPIAVVLFGLFVFYLLFSLVAGGGLILLALALLGVAATLVMPIVGIASFVVVGAIASLASILIVTIFNSVSAGTGTLVSGSIQIPVSGGLSLVRVADFAASVLGVLLTFSGGSIFRGLTTVVAIPAYLMGQSVASLEGLFSPVNSINSLGGSVYAGINAIFGEIQGFIGMVGNGLRFINTEAINSVVNLLSSVPSVSIPAGTSMAGVTHATTGVVANAWLP